MSTIDQNTVAVGPLSEAIAPPGVDPSLVSRQIRHWTNSGLLTTVDDKHGGSGKHRRYDLTQSYHSALLAELAQYSLTIGTLQKAIDSLNPIVLFPLTQSVSGGPNSLFLFSIDPATKELTLSTPFADIVNEELEVTSIEAFQNLKTGILVDMHTTIQRVEKLFNTNSYQQNEKMKELVKRHRK